MTETYKLSTIKDIFEKVPADRIAECLRELGVLLEQSAKFRDLVLALAARQGVDVPSNEAMVMPDEIEWVDDGAGHLELGIHSGGAELGRITTELKQ